MNSISKDSRAADCRCVTGKMVDVCANKLCVTRVLIRPKMSVIDEKTILYSLKFVRKSY